MPQQADTGPVEALYFQYMVNFGGISFHFFPETAHHGPNRNLEGIIWTSPASSRPYLDTPLSPLHVWSMNWTLREAGDFPQRVASILVCRPK